MEHQDVDRSTRGEEGQAASEPDATPRPRRFRRTAIRDVALAAAGIGVGVALALAPGWLRDEPTGVVLPVPQAESAAMAESPSVPVGEVPGASSAVAAVDRFLAAEQAQDLESSFALLSDDDRRSVPDAATWVSVHPDVLPPVLGYEVGSAEPAADGGVIVSSTVRFEPGLDEFRGLVAGSAAVRWGVVQDANGWRISLADTTVEPIYPDEGQVLPAAQRWLDEGPCDPAGSNAPNVTFLGSRIDLLRSLCDQPGATTRGVERLDDQVARNELVSAFGADVVQWARLVPLDGPVAARLVLAPVGDDWRVVDVIPAPTS